MELDPFRNLPQRASQSGREIGVYEMLWDCEYCGTKKLLGLTHRFCPNCGAGQNPAKRYFPPDSEKIAVKDHPYYGADRLCPFCRNPNSAKSQFCGQCGSPLDQAAEVKLSAEQVRLPGGGGFADLNANPTGSASPVERAGPMPLWILLLAAAAVVFAAVAMFWTETLELSLDRFGWQRSIRVEAFLPRQAGSWCDSMPYDAYSVMRRQQVRSYRQIPNGESCSTRRFDRGDGTYAESLQCTPQYRNEPVYDLYCDFTVNRWGYSRTVETRGQDHNPVWGALSLNGAGGNCMGCEREAGRQEVLYFYFNNGKGKGQDLQCPVPANLWSSAKLHSNWTLEQGILLSNLHCDSLKPAD